MTAKRKTPKRLSAIGTIAPRKGWDDKGNPLPPFKAWYIRNGQRQTPGHVFHSWQAADTWLREEERLIDRGEWTPTADRARAERLASTTFGEYARGWVARRQHDGRPLKDRTRAQYLSLIDADRWLGEFDGTPLDQITRADVERWYHDPSRSEAKTTRRHAYILGRTVYKSAVRAGLAAANPFDIEGGTGRGAPAKIDLYTVEEITRLTELMPERHRALVALAAWCGLRIGELMALRRSDLRQDADGTLTVHVRRGVVKVNREQIETTPKSAAGLRDVVVPPHIAPMVLDHRARLAQPGRDGLMFPPTHGTGYLTPNQVYGTRPGTTPGKRGRTREGSGFYLARHLIGKDDLSFHKLRHFAGTSYAIAGATDRELMDFMGHADLTTTQIYQHAAKGRAVLLAARMGELAKPEG
jgi:integrase